MAEAELRVRRRTALGKKTRFLRRAGQIPANIYGQGQESLAIELAMADVTTLLRHGAGNQLYSLTIEGDTRAAQPVVIRGVQRHPVSRLPLHIDLLRVSLTEVMTATVPVVFTGASPAIRDGGVLVHGVDHVTVSALPGTIPQHIEVDLAFFQELESVLHASDLPLPAGVELVTEAGALVAKVASAQLREGAAGEDGVPVEGAPQ